MLRDVFLFAGRAIGSPGRVGAVMPSGRGLARLMAAGLGPDSGPVVEIGPGTGSLTQGLLDAGVPETDLILIEMDREFCARLTARFPGARVVNAPAQAMPALGLPAITTVISGLPLLNFPPALQHQIVRAVFQGLAPNGRLVQFTYGRHPPVAPEVRDDLDLRWRRRGKVWANLPPATVYEFHRADGS